MEFFWISVALFLTVPRIAGLQCYSCDGDRDCFEKEVCEEHQEECSTTVMTIITRPKISTYFLKGCDVSGKPNNSISHFSGNQVVFLAEEYCNTELCNSRSPNVVDILVARGRHRRTLDCYSCAAADETCFNSSQTLMSCARPEEDCVDITSFTSIDSLPDEQHIKGCGQLSHCQALEPLGFHNRNSFHLIKCCNSSRCNSDTQDYKNTPLPLNGVTCFSCEGNSTHGCSPDAVTEMQCQGPMNQCLEASGIHGTSALVCSKFTSHQSVDPNGKIDYNFYSPAENVTCSPVHNACMDAQLEFSIVSHTLYMIHRDCATTKQPNGGKESSTSSDKYFDIKYLAEYCSRDLCNAETAVADVPKKPRRPKEKCKPSSSKKCYSGINFHDSEPSLELVTCHSDFDSCYQGSGDIMIGHAGVLMYVRSCQSRCAVPQKQVFGPIEINVPQGACCFGNYCNKKENADPALNNHASGAASRLYGNGTFNHTSNFTNFDSEYGLHWDFECEGYIGDSDRALPTLHPGSEGSLNAKGSTLQLSPLLVPLGLTVLGLWVVRNGPWNTLTPKC